MGFPDEDAPVFEADFDPVSISDDTMFDTSSSSNDSMSTISSSQVADYFQSINGFLFSADESVPSVFPVHPDTIQLAFLGHTVMRLSQDGQNVPPEAALALKACAETGGARVLQMMSNVGIWAQEVAQEFPNATIVSVDTKPMTPHRPHPRIKFEVYDVYAGIAEPDDSFDLVQATSCLLETRNFNFLLREMHRVLKPDGILLLMEIPYKTFEAERASEHRRPSPSRDRLERLVRRAFELQGIDLTILDNMSDHLSPSHSHWSERLIDPAVGLVERPCSTGSTRGFYSIIQRTRLVPDGPWHEDEAQRTIGMLERSVLVAVWRMSAPVLCITGMEQADAQRVVDEALEELKDTKIHRYLKCYRWSARKIPA